MEMVAIGLIITVILGMIGFAIYSVRYSLCPKRMFHRWSLVSSEHKYDDTYTVVIHCERCKMDKKVNMSQDRLLWLKYRSSKK